MIYKSKNNKMKKILTVLFLMITLNAYSQFEVSSSLGQGIKFNNDFDYTLYQSTVSIQAGFTFEKFTLNSISTSVITDSVTSFYAGIQPAFTFWEDPAQQKKMQVSGLAMIGTEGNKLAGLGFAYSKDKLTFGINGMREFKLNETWVEFVLGFNLYSE